MPTVSGSLKLVTNSPALVSQAWVRSTEVRPSGSAVIIDDPDIVLVSNGDVSFSCEPGPAVLALTYVGGLPTKTIPLLVGTGAAQTLGSAVQAALAADGADYTALEQLKQEMSTLLGSVLAEAEAADASAKAAKADADRAKAEADRVNTPHTHKTDDVTDAVSTIGGAANANRLVKTGADGQVKLAAANIRESADLVNKAYVDAEVAKKPNVGDFPQTRLLAANVDLKTITESGTWMQTGSANAKPELNYPINEAGLLEVENYGGMTMQRYTVYSTGVTYVRNRYHATWYGWKELPFKGHTHNLSNITDLPNVATSTNTANSIATRNANGILAVSTPTSNNDAANKAYVDAQIASTANTIPKIQVVTALPSSPDASTLYLVKES